MTDDNDILTLLHGDSPWFTKTVLALLISFAVMLTIGFVVERILERALRAVFKSKSETYNELLTKAGLPSLHQQRLQNIAIFKYKVKNGLMPSYITELFNTTPKQYNLRNTDFNIPHFRSVHYGKHSLRYFGPHLWNKLDKTDREKPNLKSFKNSIKSKNLSYLIDNCKKCDICC